MTLPESIRPKVEQIIDWTGEAIQTEPQLVPTAYIISGANVAVVATPFRDANEKNMTKDALASMCQKLDADLFVYVLESWMLKVDETDKEVESFKTGAKQIRHHPERIEVVAFQIETKTHAWLAQGEIIRDSFNQRRMLPVQWFDGGFTEGRFTRILNKLRAVK